jgi:hypothetical protein
MSGFLFFVVGAFIGIVSSVIISRYYYLKQTTKRLTPYIHLASPILRGVDLNVRKALKIYYKDVEVDDLFDLQFIIANEGNRPIRGYVKPLSLSIPKNIKIIDSSILLTHPKDREVQIRVEEQPENNTVVKFDFPILNSGDFFLAKLLLDGNIKTSQILFEITDEDLPHEIKPLIWPTMRIMPAYSSNEDDEKPRKFWLFVGTVSIMGGLLFAYLSFMFTEFFYYSWQNGDLGGFELFNLIIFALLVILSFTLFGTAIITFTSSRKIERRLTSRRFNLPSTVHSDELFLDDNLEKH